jgi:hypothetical protein
MLFGNAQLPSWWLSLLAAYYANFSWWPRVIGLPPETYYSVKLYFTIALGLALFLPQVETTFVSLIRRKSPIGTPYVDRTHFACPVCGTINRPSAQFCVKCGSQISTGTRYWGKPTGDQGSLSFLKGALAIASFIGFFLGIFDTTVNSALARMSTDSAIAMLGTVVSILPSAAGYLALKEGPLRRYASLRQFDKLVFGNWIWIAFGMFSMLLAIDTFLFGVSVPGETILLLMQALLGVLLLSYPIVRRQFARPGSYTLSYDKSRVW